MPIQKLKPSSIARALEQEGHENVLVLDISEAEGLFTPKRRELLNRISQAHGESVTELAEALGRKNAAVSRDLKKLFKHDLIDFTRDGGRKVPVVMYENYVICDTLDSPSTEGGSAEVDSLLA